MSAPLHFGVRGLNAVFFSCPYSVPSTYRLSVSPEERARAVVEHFAASLPPAVRPDLEQIITRAIRRAVHQELARLERFAVAAEIAASGRGKQAKGHDPAAVHFHREWAERFRTRRKHVE
jgi:hypothetical protein